MIARANFTLTLGFLLLALGGCASGPAIRDSRVAAFTKDLGIQATPWGNLRVLFPMASIARASPRYPLKLRAAGIQGEVVVDALVAPDGVVEDVRVHRSSGYKEFDESARVALGRWRFPAQENGSLPTKEVTRQTFAFNISE